MGDFEEIAQIYTQVIQQVYNKQEDLTEVRIYLNLSTSQRSV